MRRKGGEALIIEIERRAIVSRRLRKVGLVRLSQFEHFIVDFGAGNRDVVIIRGRFTGFRKRRTKERGSRCKGGGRALQNAFNPCKRSCRHDVLRHIFIARIDRGKRDLVVIRGNGVDGGGVGVSMVESLSEGNLGSGGSEC